MRDLNRLKEKYDVTLDSRQVVSLAIGALVVVGAVFVLGVVVGKKLTADDRTAQAPDLLSALDQRAAAMEQARSTPAVPALTFQDELTKATPKRVEPSPKPDKVAEPSPRAESVAAVAEAGGSAEKAGPAAREPATPTPDLEAGPEEPTPPRAPDPAAEQVALAPAPVAEPTATRTASPSSPAMKDAFARAQKSPPTAAGGPFTLQLSASQDRAEADRFAAKVRDRGYAPFVAAVEVPGKGTWFRVRMGSFPTREAAVRYLQDFKRETSLEAFVASN